jgi:hypothetical protein
MNGETFIALNLAEVVILRKALFMASQEPSPALASVQEMLNRAEDELSRQADAPLWHAQATLDGTA